MVVVVDRLRENVGKDGKRKRGGNEEVDVEI